MSSLTNPKPNEGENEVEVPSSSVPLQLSGEQEASNNPPSSDSIPKPKPAAVNEQTMATSPTTARRTGFVPERKTLRDVKAAGIRNPLTIASGFVNTVAGMMEERVWFGPRKTTRDPQPEETKKEDQSDSDSEETFEVSSLTMY